MFSKIINIFLFIYNIRKTILDEFLNLGHFNINNFWLDTKVWVIIPVSLQNFKLKNKDN